ncbi:MAG: carboxypeptidase regulatory-like domain-containing protein [Planctomycetota bacterium]
MRHILLVYHPGFASVYYDFPGLELSSTELDLGVLQLAPPGLVQGRVLDSAGSPVSGARVELVGKNDDRRRLCGEDSPTEELATWYTDERQTIGDEGGHFLFGTIAPGHYSLSAMAEGRAWTTPLEFQLEAAGDRKEVELVFLDGGTLSGRVQDERGLPVAGVSVHVRLEPVTMTGFSTDVRSEADGTFEVRGLTAGHSYNLEVFPWLTVNEDPCTPWLYSSLEGVSPDTGVAVVTLHRGVCIDGRVFDAAGQPQYGLWIALENAQGEPGLGTSTDSEGRFLLGVEPDTTWTLTVSGPKGDAAFTPLSVERNVAAGTRDLVLRIPR